MKRQRQKNNQYLQPNPTTELMGSYEQIPKFMQENQHIRQGYRIGYDSPQKVIKSLFMIHNETVNIWTHLIGAFVLTFLAF